MIVFPLNLLRSSLVLMRLAINGPPLVAESQVSQHQNRDTAISKRNRFDAWKIDRGR
jgi:hypothetical protein